MIYDSFLTAQAAYNSRSPATAVGSALDAIVAVNGIARMPAVYSTATETIVGTAGTTITNGVVQDVNGNKWFLPATVVIPSGGSTSVTVTCQTAGAITANPGDISTIVTPQLGWTSATNSAAATVGSPAETDSKLRARQAQSTAQPSLTVLTGLKGALAAVQGVTRFAVYENATNATNSNGIPANSICAVVEGGSSASIANAIFNKKGPGCGTYGTTAVSVTDSYGQTTTINYDVVAYTQIDVTVNVKKLSGYSSTTTSAIQNAIVSYLNSNPIGGTVYYGNLWGSALGANPSVNAPAFSITSLTCAVHLGTQFTTGLTNGQTGITSLAVQALTVPVTSGQSLVIGTGATTQTVTASANAAVGATSISVNSFTANAAYASGTPVSFAQGTADIPIAFNYASQGVVANIIVNAS